MPRPPGSEGDRTHPRETELLTLRRNGMSYTAIAQRTGIDRSNAHKIVMRALRRDHSEAVEDLRREESVRLDAMLEVWLPLALGKPAGVDADGTITEAVAPDPIAADKVLRIADRRARLFGMDAPTRHVVTSALDESIEGLLEELATLPKVDQGP